MDNADDQLHVDWKRWLQTIANLVAQPLTAGMIPDIPFTKIAMTLSPRLLGRTTAGAGAAEQITVSAPLTLAAGALGLSTPLLAIYGGTGFASYAVGDLLYADTTTTLAKLADVSAGSYLRSGGVGVAPLWSTAKLPNTATTGDLLYASASNTYSNLADVAAGSYLRAGGVTTAPLWSTVTIPNTAVTGDLWYASASNTVIARTIGSANDVLTVSGGIPTWAPAAAVATTVTITDDTTTNATMYPTWVTAASGNLPIKVSSTKLSFNPSTGTLTGLLAVLTTSVSTPSLISTGALTITPAAGSNLNVTLSTTGDFRVNSTQLVVDTSAARVGIKTAVPTTALDIDDATGFTVRNGATDGFNLTQSGANQWDYQAISGGSTLRITNANVQATVKMAVGAGMTPTAKLHLAAGTASATTAPLKFNSGSLMSTAEAGAVEFLTDDYYATITTGAARKGIVLNDGTALTSGRVPFATTNGRLTDSANLTFISPALTIGVAGITRGEVDFAGNTSGTLVLRGPSTASGTLTLPAGTTDFSATGGTSQVVKQTSAGGAFTVATVDASELAGTTLASNVVTSSLTTVGTLGSLTVTGLITANGGILVNGGTFAAGRIYSDATSGTVIVGRAGASFDLRLINSGGSPIMNVATGTTAAAFAGAVTVTGTTTTNGALDINGTPTIKTNNVLLTGVDTGAVARGLIGMNNADKVSIASSGNAVLIGGATSITSTLDVTSSVTLTAKVTKYNNVTTAGWGVPAIYGSGRSTAQTAAVASVAAYTVPAADGSFEVSANVLVTTATTHNFTVAVDYTDEGNTARTLTLNFSQVAGTLATAITNVTGAGPYEGVPLHIRCKASTAITVKTVGTFTTVTYNVEGSIRQIA